MDKSVSMIRIKHWTDIVQAANESGMRKNEWCEKNGVNINNFYYWQRRIRKMALSESVRIANKTSGGNSTTDVANDAKFFELSLQPGSSPLGVSSENAESFSSFISDQGSISGVSIRCGSFSIDVQEGFSKRTLSSVIEVLKNV